MCKKNVVILFILGDNAKLRNSTYLIGVLFWERRIFGKETKDVCCWRLIFGSRFEFSIFPHTPKKLDTEQKKINCSLLCLAKNHLLLVIEKKFSKREDYLLNWVSVLKLKRGRKVGLMISNMATTWYFWPHTVKNSFHERVINGRF